MFKKITIVLCLLILASCGSKKRAAYRKRKAETRKEIVEKKTEKPDKKAEETETLESTSTTVVNINTVEDYINYFSPIAKQNMAEHGIPASITMAQAILESGAGKGTLVKKANNHFGIKCHNWEGAGVYHDDDEKDECFRKYDNPAHSFEDHSLFLTTRGRYAFLFDLKKSDYKGWAKGLRKAGYATDRRYPEKLIGLIERYELYELDKEVLKGDYEEVVEVPEVANVATHTVQKGETLYSISRRYQLTVDRLKQLNGLRDNIIEIGQELIIRR